VLNMQFASEWIYLSLLLKLEWRNRKLTVMVSGSMILMWISQFDMCDFLLEFGESEWRFQYGILMIYGYSKSEF